MGTGQRGPRGARAWTRPLGLSVDVRWSWSFSRTPKDPANHDPRDRTGGTDVPEVATPSPFPWVGTTLEDRSSSTRPTSRGILTREVVIPSTRRSGRVGHRVRRPRDHGRPTTSDRNVRGVQPNVRTVVRLRGLHSSGPKSTPPTDEDPESFYVRVSEGRAGRGGARN